MPDNRLPTNQSQIDIEAALQDVKTAIANLNFILSAQNIAYDSNTSVKNKIDDMTIWERISVPTPTVSADGKTRTYTIDLSAYKYIRVRVGATGGGEFATDFLVVGDVIRKYYQVSSQVESYAIVSTTSSLLVYTETLSTHDVEIKSILGLK